MMQHTFLRVSNFASRVAQRPAASAASVRLYSEGPSHTTASSLTLTFASPHEVLANKAEVEWVSVPGKEGVFGVYPNHVPTISELNPGVVTVSRKGALEKFFISGGFVEVNRDSACHIAAPEAVPVDHIDLVLARQGLERSQSALSSASSDSAKATAEIGVLVHSAMLAAKEHSAH